MNKKSWLIIGIVVLVAFGIYYNQNGLLSPEEKDKGQTTVGIFDSCKNSRATGRMICPETPIESSSFSCNSNGEDKQKAIEEILENLGITPEQVCKKGGWGTCEGSCLPTGLWNGAGDAILLQKINEGGGNCHYELSCSAGSAGTEYPKTIYGAGCGCVNKKIVAKV